MTACGVGVALLLGECLGAAAGASWVTVAEATTAEASSWRVASLDGAAARSPLASTSLSSRVLYEAGRYPEAIAQLNQDIQHLRSQNDPVVLGLALSNRALVQQQLGQWTAANQAMDESLALLRQAPPTAMAQAQSIRGGLRLAQGDAEGALEAWEQAADLFDQAGDRPRAFQNQLNQAQALQALGFYRRAVILLADLAQGQAQQPDSLAKAVTLRSLGDALQVAGDLAEAEQWLTQSLAIATQIAPDSGRDKQRAIAAAHLSLGNVAWVSATADLSRSDLSPAEAIALLNAPPSTPTSPIQRAVERRKLAAAQTYLTQTQDALAHYQQAIAATDSDSSQLQARLNAFNVMVVTERRDSARALYQEIQQQLPSLPGDRTAVYNALDLAESLMLDRTRQAAPIADAATIAQLLQTAHQQAEALGDPRTRAYVLGTLGTLYEHSQQWSDAQALTQQALTLSQTVNATDIAYRWQWQLGRLRHAQNDQAGAIAAYSEAVASLQTLRGDLVAINREVQFSFRESVEPVYRELVDLLLTREGTTPVSDRHLTQARDVIEALQIAELDNFFREACLDSQFELDRIVDQTELASAVIYPILLGDRLEIIAKLPQQPLIHRTVAVDDDTFAMTLDTALAELKRPYFSQVQRSLTQQLYDWMLRPIAADLTDDIKTLVFVPDGILRNVPVAALHDGEQYLIEQYSLAFAPGLQLPDPKPLQQQEIRALVAGLSESRDTFPELPNVAREVAEIRAVVSSQVLFNDEFSRLNFERALTDSPFSIVHVATHGVFSSNAAETFILAWDERININDLGDLIRGNDLGAEPIELLVLSACRTAEGDRRAALGMAGVAVRAGARSTIASFWNVDDESGALLMSRLYAELSENPISKAEALQRAQLALLQNPQYQAPRFWASFVLLGNWL